jgi:hypothetical protein
MTYIKWIAAVALIGSATACVDNSPYGGGSGYGYAPTMVGYAQPAYSDGYYQPTSDRPSTITTSRPVLRS